MNLNHALIVGELAGNTNFALVLLCAPVQIIYVCICARGSTRSRQWRRNARFLEHFATLKWRNREEGGSCVFLGRACPHFHQGRPLFLPLLVARRTRASNGITFCPSFSLSRTKYRFPVSALLREWPQPWGLHTVHDHLLTSAYTSRERRMGGEWGGRVYRVYGWWNVPCRHHATLEYKIARST